MESPMNPIWSAHAVDDAVGVKFALGAGIDPRNLAQ